MDVSINKSTPTRTQNSLLGSAFAAVKNLFTPERMSKVDYSPALSPPDESNSSLTMLSEGFANLNINDSAASNESFRSSSSRIDDSFKSFASAMNSDVNDSSPTTQDEDSPITFSNEHNETHVLDTTLMPSPPCANELPFNSTPRFIEKPDDSTAPNDVNIIPFEVSVSSVSSVRVSDCSSSIAIQSLNDGNIASKSLEDTTDVSGSQIVGETNENVQIELNRLDVNVQTTPEIICLTDSVDSIGGINDVYTDAYSDEDMLNSDPSSEVEMDSLRLKDDEVKQVEISDTYPAIETQPDSAKFENALDEKEENEPVDMEPTINTHDDLAAIEGSKLNTLNPELIEEVDLVKINLAVKSSVGDTEHNVLTALGEEDGNALYALSANDVELDEPEDTASNIQLHDSATSEGVVLNTSYRDEGEHSSVLLETTVIKESHEVVKNNADDNLFDISRSRPIEHVAEVGVSGVTSSLETVAEENETLIQKQTDLSSNASEKCRNTDSSVPIKNILDMSLESYSQHTSAPVFRCSSLSVMSEYVDDKPVIHSLDVFSPILNFTSAKKLPIFVNEGSEKLINISCTDSPAKIAKEIPTTTMAFEGMTLNDNAVSVNDLLLLEIADFSKTNSSSLMIGNNQPSTNSANFELSDKKADLSIESVNKSECENSGEDILNNPYENRLNVTAVLTSDIDDRQGKSNEMQNEGTIVFEEEEVSEICEEEAQEEYVDLLPEERNSITDKSIEIIEFAQNETITIDDSGCEDLEPITSNQAYNMNATIILDCNDSIEMLDEKIECTLMNTTIVVEKEAICSSHVNTDPSITQNIKVEFPMDLNCTTTINKMQTSSMNQQEMSKTIIIDNFNGNSTFSPDTLMSTTITLDTIPGLTNTPDTASSALNKTQTLDDCKADSNENVMSRTFRKSDPFDVRNVIDSETTEDILNVDENDLFQSQSTEDLQLSYNLNKPDISWNLGSSKNKMEASSGSATKKKVGLATAFKNESLICDRSLNRNENSNSENTVLNYTTNTNNKNSNILGSRGFLKELNDNIVEKTADGMGAVWGAKKLESTNSPGKPNEAFTHMFRPEDLSIFQTDMNHLSGFLTRGSIYVKYDPLYQAQKPISKDTTIFVESIQDKSTTEEQVGELIPITDDREEQMQAEIDRLKKLYLQNEVAAQNEQQESLRKLAELDFKCSSARKTLRLSEERLNKLNQQLQCSTTFNDHTSVLSKEYYETLEAVTEEIERRRTGQKQEIDKLVNEKESNKKHLESAEAAFFDVHLKYDKLKVSVEDFRKNQCLQERQAADLRLEVMRQEERLHNRENAAAEELNTFHRYAADQNSLNQAEVSRMTAQLRKSELALKNLQDTLAKKSLENQKLASICDDLIAGR